MANANVERGFRPVQTLSGAPVSGKMRVFDLDASAATLAVGDVVVLSADGNVDIFTTAGSAILGVAMGFGSSSGIEFGDADGFDPENLDAPYKHTTGTAGKILVCLADDVVFSAQSTGIPDQNEGETFEILATAVGSNTRSQMEADVTGNPVTADGVVVEYPTFNSANGTTNSGYNDTAAANAEVHVLFTNTAFAQS